MKIKLTRSKPEFCLQGTEGHKVLLERISLLVRKVHVSPRVILGHVKALEKEIARYPINRVLCKVYSVPQGSMPMRVCFRHSSDVERKFCHCGECGQVSEPGSHWLAFYSEGSNIEFFDSYGNPPEFYGPRFQGFTSNYSSVYWNSTTLQSLTSNLCKDPIVLTLS
ncbi:hypothetical protein AVEN_37751-1 [Araneus ventricosus]|uniref:Uncharacterized protein n=1 Tax=Araneus ventricosus TaxID=182803 RepID=A0A4Y2BSW6_ARAVE|nr:hypothetical protein AVEN_37751-1 [Araneus ventricosus]